MERHGCVGERLGWIPRHLGCFAGDALVGVMPLYEKHNSWGEFVFDHAWAEAFQRAGIAYYPKLVNAIPFTPASGQRVPTRVAGRDTIVRALLDGACKLMAHGGFSGVHSLFVEDDAPDSELKLLNTANAVTRTVTRTDCQFHWHNQNYRDFEQFLTTLKAKKRKNIRQERARVARSGVVIQRLDGATAQESDWRDFSILYRAIYERKYGYPAFNYAFFAEIAALMPAQIQLVMARRDGAPVAAALMYLDDHTLYGRHWGCRTYLDCLHFELCYYQGIEICIERGLRRFDPGAQGEHKIARGFTPTRTHSLHWMAQSPFANAITQFVAREKSSVAEYINAVKQHSPYHHNDAAS